MIVGEDRSTDGTVEEVEKARARGIRRNHGGYIAAIKRGFREAGGEIVVTMDVDGDIGQRISPVW